MAEIPSTISTTDLETFQEAQQALQQAQAVVQFISNRLGRVYQIGPQDQVDLKTGAITRHQPEEPAEAKA